MSTDPPAAVGRCLSCDYPLRDLSTPRCPECGRAFDPADPSTMNLSSRPLVRGLTRWLLKPVGWWTVVAALALTAGLYWCTWLPFVGHEVRMRLSYPESWPFYGWNEGWTPAGLIATVRKWDSGFVVLRDARTVMLLTLGIIVLGAWVAGRTTLAVVLAAVTRRFSALLRGAWRRWACLAALGLLFWAGLKYDLAFHAAAWLSGPAIDRFAADITSRPPQFRYPDRQVGLFPARNIYWKDNTVGFQLDQPIPEVAAESTGQPSASNCWIKITVSRSADGRTPPFDEDTDRPVTLGGFYSITQFDSDDLWRPQEYPFHAGQLWVAYDTGHVPSPWVRARRRLAWQVGGQADPAMTSLRELVGELLSRPADWEYLDPSWATVGGGDAPPRPPADADEFLPLPAHVMLRVDGSRWRWPKTSPVFRELVHLGAKAVPALVEALDPGRPELAERAAVVLAQMGPVAAPAEAPLVALLSHPDPDVARAAIFTLYRMETTSAASVPALVAALDSPDACLRRYAMQNLRFAQAPLETLRPIFRRALGHADRQVRFCAALGLWQVGPDAESVADLRAAIEEVNRCAATQPQRSTLALGLDDGLRIVCAAAILRGTGDDAAAQAILCEYAERVRPYVDQPTMAGTAATAPAFSARLAALPWLAWAILAESVPAREAEDRGTFLYQAVAGMSQDLEPTDIRDVRLAAAGLLRVLVRPDGASWAYFEACRRFLQLVGHRLQAHRALGAQMATAARATGYAIGTGVGADLAADTQWYLRGGPEHDLHDEAIECSLDQRITAARRYFDLAPQSPDLRDLLRGSVQPRLRQAVLDGWRQAAPDHADQVWGVERSAETIQLDLLPIGRRRAALQTLAELARRQDAVGGAARAALLSVLDQLAGGDAFFYPEVLAAQVQLDPAVAKAHWNGGAGQKCATDTLAFSVTLLKLARVLADAGWLPPQDWADLEARATADDFAVVVAVDPVLRALVAATVPATSMPSTAPAGE